MTQPQGAEQLLSAFFSSGGALLQGSSVQATEAEASAGLAAIRAHDPAFNETAFLAQAERAYHLVTQSTVELRPELSRQVMADAAWQQHRGAIQQYRTQGRRPRFDDLQVEGAIRAAHSDAAYDTVVVRFSVRAKAYVVDEASGRVVEGNSSAATHWESDWSFQRSSHAATHQNAGTSANRCPHCGAPLALDERGVCPYCESAISGGAYDWVLVRNQRVQPTAAHAFAGAAIPTYTAAAKTARRVGCAVSAVVVLVILAVAIPIGIAVYNAVKTTSDAASRGRSAAGAATGAEPRGVPGVAVGPTTTTGPIRVAVDDLKPRTIELEQMLGHSLEVTEILLTQGRRIQWKVRDPVNRANLDLYEWENGVFQPPEPAQLTAADNLDEDAFTLEGVILDAPRALAEAAVNSGVEGAVVNVISLTKFPGQGVVWNVPFSGTREHKQLLAAPDGTIITIR